MLHRAQEERKLLTMAAYHAHERGNREDMRYLRDHTHKGKEGVLINAMRL